MSETLLPLKLPPGLFHNGTKYDSKDRWYDANGVRWRDGMLQPIGLWERLKASSFNGSNMAGVGNVLTCRILSWPSSQGPRVVLGALLAAGPTAKLYAFDPTSLTTTLTDITPAGMTGGAGNWTLNAFGGDVIASYGGTHYSWDGTLATDAVELTNDPLGDAGAGTVTTPERFLVSLASNSGTANSNPRLVQWADQETMSVWTPTPTNTAGDFELQSEGTIRAGRAGKGQTFIFTDVDMWTMTYIGGSLVYSFRQEGKGCGIISNDAVAVADGRAYWMGRDGFFMFDGYVRPLRCDVHDAVFNDGAIADFAGINSPVTAFTLSDFGEVWWLYNAPSQAYNSKYVVYNYRENHWTYGALDRAAGCDSGTVSSPIFVDKTNGFLWRHESPTGSHTGMTVYAESGPLVLDPDRVMRLQRIIPDGKNLTDAQLKVYSSFYPVENETLSSAIALANPTDVRISGKQFRLRVEELVAGAPASAWRLGTPQVGVIASSRR